MTNDELAEGAALLKAATPGDWRVDLAPPAITIRAGHTPLAEMWLNGRGHLQADAALIVWLHAHAQELLDAARRYEWLRDNIRVGPSEFGCWRKDRWYVDLPDPGIRLDTGEVFAAAIDAAMKEQP